MITMDHNDDDIPLASYTSETKQGKVATTVTTSEVLDHDLHPPPTRSLVASKPENWWTAEAYAWLVSALALAGLVILLRNVDGCPVPNWELKSKHFSKQVSITLNSVLSIFSTLMKSTILIPVMACISQMKYSWFSNSRPLKDFQAFDAAARGPSGSIQLLWTTKGRSLACLGAAIVVATLGVDFSFQQLISYPPKPLNIGVASVTRTNAYTDFQDGEITGLKSVSPSMLGAIYTGLFSYGSDFDVSPNCPTGNCTWSSTYFSLGVCSKCYKITDDLQKMCGSGEMDALDDNGNSYPVTSNYCNYTLPSGLQISGTDGFSSGIDTVLNVSTQTTLGAEFIDPSWYPICTLQTVGASWESVSRNVTTSNGTTALLSYYQILDINATECALDVCVRKYEGNMTNGIFNETVLDSYHNNTWNPADPGGIPPYWIKLPASSGYQGRQDFVVDSSTFQALNFQFGESEHPFFNGSISSTDGSQHASNDIVSFIHTLDYSELEDMMNGIAASMTFTMRTVGSSQGPANGYPGTADGVVWQDLPFVHVRWGWLTLPMLLVWSAAVLLLITIVLNLRNDQILWKGSVFAPLLSNVDARYDLSQARDLKHVERLAEDMHVKWEKTPDGYRLIQI